MNWWKRLLEKKFNSVPLSQNDDADRLKKVLKIPFGPDNPYPIPQVIHRQWSGPRLPNHIYSMLEESATKVKETPFELKLWICRYFEECIDILTPYEIARRETQRCNLKHAGYSIHYIEDLIDNDTGMSSSGVTAEELNQASGMAAASVNRGDGYDDLKFLSDLARLMYLFEIGGHHMDVDIGLGDMDMTKQYTHNDEAGQVPLMGTLARDMMGRDGREVGLLLARIKAHRSNPHSSGVSTDAYQEDIGALAAKASAGAGMYNALIASRARTGHHLAAINRVMRTMRTEGDAVPYLSTGMGANEELLGGSRNVDNFEAKRDAGLNQSVPPYLLRLEYLTFKDNRLLYAICRTLVDWWLIEKSDLPML